MFFEFPFLVALKRAGRAILSSVLAGDPTGGGGGSCRFTLWVAFFEIYNELVYDLLQPSLCPKSKKRASLRVCDDGAGNAYVKGWFWTLGAGGETRRARPRDA